MRASTTKIDTEDSRYLLEYVNWPPRVSLRAHAWLLFQPGFCSSVNNIIELVRMRLTESHDRSNSSLPYVCGDMELDEVIIARTAVSGRYKLCLEGVSRRNLTVSYSKPFGEAINQGH